MFGRKTVPMHPEDERLLEISRELSSQLSFNVNPRTISWRDRLGVRRFPPDRVMIFRGGLLAGTILLSKQAMGRLTPEEWRPLLASGIVYYKNFNTGMLRALLPMFAVVLLEPFILVANFRFLDNTEPALLRYVTVGVLFVLLGLGFLISLRRMKSLFFKGDERAAKLVGKELLLISLRKMASINQQVAVHRKGLLRPTVDERINHLVNFTPADTSM